MDMKEKLVEFLIEVACKWGGQIGLYGYMADRLIADGWAKQEWISVEDRLPEPFVSVLVQMPGEQPFPTVREGFISSDGVWQSAMFRREPGEVTHWQPMPQPPKEG